MSERGRLFLFGVRFDSFDESFFVRPHLLHFQQQRLHPQAKSDQMLLKKSKQSFETLLFTTLQNPTSRNVTNEIMTYMSWGTGHSKMTREDAKDIGNMQLRATFVNQDLGKKVIIE